MLFLQGRSRAALPWECASVRDAPVLTRMRVAIVTGGTRGIGEGIAQALAQARYNVLILGYHTDRKAALDAKMKLETEYGTTVHVVGGDISLPTTLTEMFDVVRESCEDNLTAFVHNAGLLVGITSRREQQPRPEMSAEAGWCADEYDYYQKVYPQAFRKGIDLALRCKGLKHIVAISATGCNMCQPVQPGYESPGQAKAAMEFLVRMYAHKLARQGVTVNCVIPGFVRTEAWERWFEAEPGMQEQIELAVKSTTPAGRWASAAEVGKVVAFLCLEEASFISGVALPVDGGMHLGKTA